MFDYAEKLSNADDGFIIGYWDSWTGPFYNKYSTMKYSDGNTCLNGTDRSLTITLRCGTDNKIVEVTETTPCIYIMIFETPIQCHKNIAKTYSHPDPDDDDEL
jgi:protein kinase C substrate 80K-H